MFSDSSQRLYCRVQRRFSVSQKDLRDRAGDEAGFTLLELLVVILIIGILAAIAIPSFVGQKAKAVDAQAKELVRSAETTAETIATEDGGYENVSKAEVNKYEPTIHIVASTREAYLSNATSTKTSYSVTVTATNGDQFTISKSATGQITRQCASPVTKTGCASGEASTW